MPLSDDMRRLASKWATNTGWPKRLEWIEIKGLRGWVGQRISFDFPITAVVGENGVGKSTVLQCAAAVYQHPTEKRKKSRFASDFFPDTAWDQIRDATINYEVREGNRPAAPKSVRKPGERWRGNPDRPERRVEYIDLSRVQPVPARTGYSKLAKTMHREVSSTPFDKSRLGRFSQVMGRTYELAKMSITDVDEKRSVPVLGHQGAMYSGFHKGAGETTVAELLQADLPQYGIVLIDEIETSLHPRAQRRLMRDLAAKCRDQELQVILTTHSPYVLDELPLAARIYILQTPAGREVITGVSPEFAMTKMDDVPQYECDLYVEDARAKTFFVEILAAHAPELVQRCRIIAYGAASVGQSLGQMAVQRRFPRPSCVFLDGDQGFAAGCWNLPGEDAPERVVFNALREANWLKAADRTGRPFSPFADACSTAMTLTDHHDWVDHAANPLVLGGDTLWQTMCSEWAKNCLDSEDAKKLTRVVEDAILGTVSLPVPPPPVQIQPQPTPTIETAAAVRTEKPRSQKPGRKDEVSSSDDLGPLFR